MGCGKYEGPIFGGTVDVVFKVEWGAIVPCFGVSGGSLLAVAERIWV